MLFSKKLADLIAKEGPKSRKFTEEEIQAIIPLVKKLWGVHTDFRYDPEQKVFLYNSASQGENSRWYMLFSITSLEIIWEVAELDGNTVSLVATIKPDKKLTADREISFIITDILKSMSKVMQTEEIITLSDEAILIPSQNWRSEQEPFYCLRSEFSEILEQHIAKLLDLTHFAERDIV